MKDYCSRDSTPVSRANTQVRQNSNASNIEDNRPRFSEQAFLLAMVQNAQPAYPATKAVIQGRIPNIDALNKIAETMKEEDLKEQLKRLLTNMVTDNVIEIPNTEVATKVNDLLTTQEVAGKTTHVIVAEKYEELFGKEDDGGYKKKVYNKADDANAPLHRNDKNSFKDVAGNAKEHVASTINRPEDINKVFGTKADDAKKTYEKILEIISQIITDINTSAEKPKVTIETDYNGDDEQCGPLGYAEHRNQLLHLQQAMCGTNANSYITLIHECSHLSASDIIDYGYRDSPGYLTMPDYRKVKNAAHYEYIPFCIHNSDTIQDFIPAESKNADPLGKIAATRYFQLLHNKTWNIATTIRDLYKKNEKLSRNETWMLKAAKIPYRENKANLLTVTLAEDLVHSILIMYRHMKDNALTANPSEYPFFTNTKKFILYTINQNKREGISSTIIKDLMDF